VSDGALDEPTRRGTAARLATGLNKLALALRTSAQQRSTKRGLHPAQAQILVVLANRRGGMRIRELAAELGVTSASVSDSVTAMVNKGLVRRSRAAHDGRGIEVTLTAAGRREAATAQEWPDAVVQTLDALDAEEQATLLRIVVKLILGLQEQGAISPARMCVTCRYFEADAHPGTARPHHCHFVDAPFGGADVRIDCADHQPHPRLAAFG
jgi:DNA-binding MarR family transcriptional regulator